jgi:hypothetical protein
MPNFIPTQYMSLPNPVPGTDPGPDYALNIQSCLTILDQHNHTAGSGQQITPAGLNINVDLSFQGNNATFLRSVRWSPQGSPISGALDLGCCYVAGADLYYNDTAGNQVRITQGGSVAGSAGTITGLPSGTASASYNAGTFVFQSATNTAANIDGASYIFRNGTANSKGLTLQPPSAMAANYSLTLPSIPGAQQFLAIDTSGNITGFANTSQGITAAMIANSTITATQIANGTITNTQLAAGTALANIAAKSITNSLVASNSYAGPYPAVYTQQTIGPNGTQTYAAAANQVILGVVLAASGNVTITNTAAPGFTQLPVMSTANTAVNFLVLPTNTVTVHADSTGTATIWFVILVNNA